MKEEIINDKFKYKITKKIGVISVNSTGWKKEVNLISYNNKKSLVDIRLWSPSGKMSKGITLEKRNLKKLIELLNKIDDEEI